MLSGYVFWAEKIIIDEQNKPLQAFASEDGPKNQSHVISNALLQVRILVFGDSIRSFIRVIQFRVIQIFA